MRLGDLDALCEFFQKRYEYLRNASERQLPNGYVEVDLDIQCGAIIAKEFLDKAKTAPTIDPEDLRPKGRWVQDEDCEHRYNCSACNHWYVGIPKNYCPNCGAKMEEKVKEWKQKNI